LSKIHILVNTASVGKEPILGYLEKYFSKSHFSWDLTVVHSAPEAYSATLKYMHACDYLAAYGGDGTIMQVSRALYQSSTPLIILPGGTANIMAKELDIPLDIEKSIQLIAQEDFEIIEIDMGLVNGTPFLIRLNLGIMADMIIDASPEMKQNWGQWAYGISAFQDLHHPLQTYSLVLDGHSFSLEAVALTITNAGNLGFKGFSFLPGIKMNDGLLDIIALKQANFDSIMRLTGSTLLQTDSSVLRHWKAREITLEMNSVFPFICDDIPQKAERLLIKVSPKSLSVAVPKINYRW